MTMVDEAHPAPCNGVQTTCDAPVLGEAEEIYTTEKAMSDFERLFQHAINAPTKDGFVLCAGKALEIVPFIIARVRAAEERERTLAQTALRVLTSWDQEDEPDIVDAFEALRKLLGYPDTSRPDGGLSSLAVSAQRAGDGGETE